MMGIVGISVVGMGNWIAVEMLGSRFVSWMPLKTASKSIGSRVNSCEGTDETRVILHAVFVVVDWN